MYEEFDVVDEDEEDVKGLDSRTSDVSRTLLRTEGLLPPGTLDFFSSTSETPTPKSFLNILDERNGG